MDAQRVGTIPRRAAARRPRQAHAAVRSLATALLDDDRELVWALAMDHLRASGSRLAVFGDLLHPAQRRLSDLWYSSRVGHADEARAARSVLDVVRRLPPTPSRTPVPCGSRCILTALPGEQHTLGLEMLRGVLEDDGWTVEAALGEERDEFLDRAWTERPQFVGVTAGYLERTCRLAALVAELRHLRVPVLAGGQALGRSPDLWRQLAVTGLAQDLRIGLVLARRTIAPPTRNGRPPQEANHTPRVWL